MAKRIVAPKEVREFCTEHNLTTDQFYGREVYPGSLYLNSVTTLIPGFNPKVVGGLSLNYLTTLIPGFNPTVGWSLSLDSITTLIPGFNPKVGGNLVLRSLQLLSLGDISAVGGLSLVGCTSLRSLGSNLKSVGYLELEGTPIYVIPEDLVIKEMVYLDGPDRYIPTAEARRILQDFKDSIKGNGDAGEILLDRLGRPLWQIAYATDFLNGDIQV